LILTNRKMDIWFNAFKLIITELPKYLPRRGIKKEKAFEAVEAVLNAANRTSIFITKRRKGTYKTNIELSEIWINAASKVRDLDGDLYNRLLSNAEYWSNPESWTDEQIGEARIGLLDIKRDARGILNN